MADSIVDDPPSRVHDRPARSAPWSAIEDRYWRPIESITTLESVLADDTFFVEPGRHVALFSDHGVVHARDVAERAHRLAHDGNGVLWPARSDERVAFIASLAFALAYLHDIGMSPVNTYGRRVHAAFAAQTALSPGFDDIAAALLDDPVVEPVLRRLQELHDACRITAPVVPVFRELLATTYAHSKSAVPARVLDDRVAFRAALVRAVATPLPELAEGRSRDPGDPLMFAWLADAPADADTDQEADAFADDAIVAVRVLRAADALRQRGTTLRTSSGFEIFTDHRTGLGLFALRSQNRTILTLVSDDNPFSGAEANVRDAYLTDDGVLRVSFHRERFASLEIERRVVDDAAALVADIEADAIGSFPSRVADHSLPLVELVRHDRSSTLVARIVDRASERFAHLAGRVVLVEDEPVVLPPDRFDATAGTPFEPTAVELETLVHELAAHGWNTSGIGPDAFEGVRRFTAAAGDDLIAPHTASQFVFVPFGAGLAVSSVGGYGDKVVPPWVPVGITGVVRAGERNSSIHAVADVDVLAIPAEAYLRSWFRPYDPDELRAAAKGWAW